MATGVYVPIWGLQMTEATVVEWLVELGAPAVKGQGVVVIETYKISGEVESPEDGVLRRRLVEVGEEVKVGALLAVIGRPDEDEAAVDRVLKEAPFVTDLQVTQPRQKEEATPVAPSRPSPTALPQETAPEREVAGPWVRATPLARKIARERGLDLRMIRGSGSNGRIYRRDVEAASADAQARPGVPPTQVRDQVIPLTPLRRAIIKKTMQTVNVPYGALSRVVRADNLLTLRESLSEPFERRHGLKLSMTHLFFKMTALALQETPILNATLDGDRIILRGAIHLGMVVTAPGGGGIMIPVLRDVQDKSLYQIAAEWAVVTQKIRDGRATLEDLSGGTFTISNVGSLGIDIFTPLIHPPEAGILGITRVQEAPVVEDGRIVVGRTLSLIVGADHRVFDADPIGRFLATMDGLFQEPAQLLI
jgi:pyruvate dehydrogenase E2 component (dihydrolipoamide acetyltransferase)